MQDRLQFRKGDLFFEPVLSFFASMMGFMAISNGMTINDRVSGRFRGEIIPQVTFHEPSFLYNAFQGKLPSELTFTLDTDKPPKSMGRSIDSHTLVIFWGQQLIGHSFAIAKDSIEKRHGQDRKRTWPSIFQFAYHVRNGCFHGNTFNIQKASISEAIPTAWRGREITYGDNGREVVGEFMASGDLLTLLNDMQKEL